MVAYAVLHRDSAAVAGAVQRGWAMLAEAERVG